MRPGPRWQAAFVAAIAIVFAAFAAHAESSEAPPDEPPPFVRDLVGAPPGSGPAPARATPGHRLGPVPGRFSGSLTFATEYAWRGVSQSNRQPVGQAEIDWRFDHGLYLGTWISNVDFGDGASFELDFFAGWATKRGNWKLDLGFIYYLYPLLNSDRFYPEFTINASYDFGRFDVGGFFAATWNHGQAGDPAYYPAIDLRIDLVWTLMLRTHVGYQFGNGSGKGADEFDWSVGVSASHWGFDARLAYIDTNRSADQCGRTSNCDARAFFSLTRAF